ncbi:MAG: hypothetical protein ACJ766_18530 [Thermoleophilaceae bacterium]
MSDSQRDALRALIKAQGDPSTSLKGALEALDYARWDELPDASLPWDRVAEMARAQDIGEADVVWDLAAGMPSGAKRAKRSSKSAASRRAAKTRRQAA